MSREFREAQMSPMLTAWLKDQGFTVYTEVPYYGRNIDMVGIGEDDSIVCIEMKTCLTRQVIYQANILQLITDQCWCAVASNPTAASVLSASKRHLGVLRVNGAVSVVIEPNPDPRVKPFNVDRFLEVVRQYEPGGVAGMPNVKGVGPAVEVERRIAEYRASHPKATWRELYDAIPNHYANFRSMQGAMSKLQERRLWREKWGGA